MSATTSSAGQVIVVAAVALLLAVGTLGALAGWLFGMLAALRARAREAETARQRAMSERDELDDLLQQWRDYAESLEPNRSLEHNRSLEPARVGPRPRFAAATLAAIHAAEEM